MNGLMYIGETECNGFLSCVYTQKNAFCKSKKKYSQDQSKDCPIDGLWTEELLCDESPIKKFAVDWKKKFLTWNIAFYSVLFWIRKNQRGAKTIAEKNFVGTLICSLSDWITGRNNRKEIWGEAIPGSLQIWVFISPPNGQQDVPWILVQRMLEQWNQLRLEIPILQ